MSWDNESEEVSEVTDKLLPVSLPEQVVDRTQAVTPEITEAQQGWPFRSEDKKTSMRDNTGRWRRSPGNRGEERRLTAQV